jgi:hypothetical protein
VCGVSFSRGLKWLVAPLLILTLGLKWAGSGRSITRESEEQRADHEVSDFLVRNHFSVVGSRKIVFGMQLISAISPMCNIRVALTSSRGWHRDLIRELAAGSAQTFVVFGGRIYHQQPMWLTVPDFLWSRLLEGLGFHAQPAPVITVMAGANCDAERLPWAELTGR